MCQPQREGSSQRRERRRKTQNIVKGIALSLLKNVIIIVHILIDQFLEFVLEWYLKERKRCKALRENFFVQKPAVDIAQMIRQRELTSYQVVKAYIDRMKEVNPLLNAVVDGPFEEALEIAKGIDERIAKNQISEQEFNEKPFLGVPFTTKDSTAVGGKLHTLGLVSRRNVRAPEDAECVRLVKEAGAIIIATTNIPEVNKWVESRNNVTGQTNNPYDTRRTVGGSSGGEGAMVTSCATAFGLGTDIGGSIRIPASYCGIYGHKPTTGLVNTKGCTFRTGEEEHTMVVAGPMTRHAKDLMPLFKVLVGPQKTKTLRLDEPVNVKRLRYFFMTDLGDLRAPALSTEMKQVVSKVTNHLEQITGKMCKRAKLEGMEHTSKMWTYWMTQEPADFNKLLGNGESVNGVLELCKKLVGQSDYTMASIYSLIFELLPIKNVEKIRKITEDLTKDLEDLLGDDGILIFPSASSSAGFHYSALVQIFKFSYFSIFNVLQVPVTQVPIPGLDSKGMPVGVQIVATKNRDRDCIAVAQELEKAFGGWTPPFQINQE